MAAAGLTSDHRAGPGRPSRSGRERGLTKRARGTIIAVVVIVWLGGNAVWIFGSRAAANGDLSSALGQARAAAPGVDPAVVFPVWARAAVTGDPHAMLDLPQVPHLAKARTTNVDAKPGEVTVSYEVDSWGKRQCLTLTRTTTDWSVTKSSC